MLGIMLQKMWHKKWMNLCLLLGCILLVATVVSFPLYQRAAYDRMIQDEFSNYISSEGLWPTMNKMTTVSTLDREGSTITKMESLVKEINNNLGVDTHQTILYYNLTANEAKSLMNRSDKSTVSCKIGAISGIEDNINIISGEMYSESGIREDGSLEVIVSQSAMVNLGLLVGETIEFTGLKDAKGNLIRLYISGVYTENSENDAFYWQSEMKSISDTCFINIDLFRSMFTGENAGKYTITCRYTSMFEYENITADKVDKIVDQTDYYTEKSAYRSIMKTPDYRNTLDTYQRKKDRISQTLIILQVPVLVMLAAFLFMISGQMYEMEKNEISVIKSRGSSGGQIFRLYLYQGLILTTVGALIGVPLGRVLSKVLGATRNFLEFDTSENLTITFTKEAWIYVLAAMFVTLMSMTLPAIKHSKVTIVKLKQSKAQKKKSWWEKFYLDIVLLLVSLYGYYSFHKNMSVADTVLQGESLDPLLYISSSVFIVGAGLLFLRIQPYLVKLIYMIGKKFWGPALHVSFMENIKNGRKQQLIMLFLIMTISLGMFHATVARTILENAIENTDYKDGVDVVIKEVWTQQVDSNGNATGVYTEPEYNKYSSMECAAGYTRVYNDSNAYISLSKNDHTMVTIMGIHTKEFGQMTMVDRSLNEDYYYNYLNKLAEVENGVLLSRNFETKLGFKVGDSITFYNETGSYINGKVVDFYDYWPAYELTSSWINPDGTAETGENYQIVTHYDLTRQKFGILPYEVWIDLKDGYDSEDVYNWIEESGIRLKKYVNREDDLEATRQDPLLQGTNGVLTMGFVVTLILCAVGYLIYWVMSIRERELIFGVLRATGFHKSEVFKMILTEQIFSGVFSVFAGIGIGKLTSKMFVPILQQAYASTDQILPMKLITNEMDMYRLYAVIGTVMVICLAVLIMLLFKMNVTKALKLGEE